MKGSREVPLVAGLQRWRRPFAALLAAVTFPLFIMNADMFTPEAARRDRRRVCFGPMCICNFCSCPMSQHNNLSLVINDLVVK